MFLREPQGLDLAGGAGAYTLRRQAIVPLAPPPALPGWRASLADVDWTPDLGAQIGSLTWWRGLASLAALCSATWLLAPGRPALIGAAPAPLAGDAWEEARPLAITPLGQGADTGRRLAANDLVRPLAEVPERPQVQLTATLGEGDALARALQRAGVGHDDAGQAAALVAQAVPLGDLPSGTRLSLTLGRRPNRSVPRPLEALALRARFDLSLSLQRAGAGLAMIRQPIAVDHTPLRLQGLVGSSLYRSVRAAGVPGREAEDYIKALATKLSIGRDIAAADSFDVEIEQARAATGEVQLGRLLFAGLDRDGSKLQLVRWTVDGRDDWFDAHGEVRHQGVMGLPVAGHVTSTFGWRMHPILGFMKLHKGMDIGAPYGSPIFAAMDGVVQQVGRAGGYGNFVRLAHGGNIATGYGHMSRIAVRPGMRVRRGEVIGYVGSTGLSTGPHLHWEVWKNGVSINPKAVSFDSVTALSGEAMRAFKARVAMLAAVRPGGR